MQAGYSMGNLASAIGIPAAAAEDQALVAALKAGSEDAFALLIAQYSQPIYSLIARSLTDPADAPDVTQEVFIKVFRSIGSFHGDCTLRTWMYRIAIHQAANQRRWWSRHRRQEVAIDAPVSAEASGEDDALCLSALLADRADSPYDQLASAQVRQRVEDALRQVPEAFRVVVILREIEGFSYDEISDVLKLPAGTVKSRLTRGRTALKEILNADGFGCVSGCETCRKRAAL